MFRNAVKYKDCWLAPGSEAFKLHEEKEFKKLNEHLQAMKEKEEKLVRGG